MPRPPAERIQRIPRACSLFLSGLFLSCLFLSGCTETPEPRPLPPTTAAALPSTLTPTAQPPTTGPPPGPTPAPAPAPSNSVVFTPAFQELRATLELFSREKLDEGASAVLIKAKVGQQEWTLAEGVLTREGRVAVQPGHRFHVGEQFRTLLAVSVMKLVEEGRLGLDDPLAAYLPGSVSAGTAVTIRQLLGDVADLPAGLAASERAPGAPGPDALLGLVVEQLRGVPLGTVLRTDVLTPLNLRSTELLDAHSAIPDDLVHGYVQLEGETMDVTRTGLQDGIANGGLVSTVEDISAFHTALLRGELVQPASLIAMKGTVFDDYGLGLDHWDDRCTNGSYYGHAGDVPGYGSIAMSSADGNRQLSIFMAYPPQAVSTQPSALALEMTGVAQVALNAGCRFQFR
ncbi:putative beta-lactamase family protein [Paenarthrobacter aurescens TC1]|uniref:Beta-lactamase family protein n=1 Tax=Paenarthrobacter aurescens (strain TC1) TaxID=290340 RepID=A1R6D1_PAEAT|nr:putative beta-lactamase family protein [Paenarthrobacter aurescens TC1]